MHWAVLILGGLVVLGGILSLSQATMGVGIVAIGCFLGIAARLLQASTYQKQLADILSDRPTVPTQSPSASAEEV